MSIEAMSRKFLNSRHPDPSHLEALRDTSRSLEFSRILYQTPQVFQKLIEYRENVDALKTLANLLYHLPEARTHLVESVGIAVLIKELPGYLKSYGDTVSFVWLRIWFLITIEGENANRLLDIGVNLLQLPSAQDDSNPSLSRATVEVLRILYNLCRIELIHGAQDFGYSCLKSTKNLGVLGNSWNLLLSTGLPPQCDPSTVLEAFTALISAAGDSETKQDSLEFLPSALIVLTHSCEDKSWATLRSFLRRKILPLNFDRTVPVTEGKTVKSQLARLLQDLDDRLTLALGDFLLVLVRRRLNRLVFQFGYGILAGYLYSRNLLGSLPDVLQNTRDLGESSDEEAIKHGALSSVDPISGKEANLTTRALVEMTEEEQEEEAQKLFAMLDRLEKSGHVKLVRRDA